MLRWRIRWVGQVPFTEDKINPHKVKSEGKVDPVLNEAPRHKDLPVVEV
jgi:hypothetical protein